MIRELLQNEIAEQTSDKEVAVLLSGGVDSLSVAFAAQRLGKKDYSLYISFKRSTKL